MSNFVAPGVHLLIDFWGAEHLQDKAHIKEALKKAAEACGATVLKIVLHSFGKGAGMTGVAVLAESHISIHTWPEINYIALDVFMCGSCDPHKSVVILREFFPAAESKNNETLSRKKREAGEDMTRCLHKPYRNVRGGNCITKTPLHLLRQKRFWGRRSGLERRASTVMAPLSQSHTDTKTKSHFLCAPCDK